MPAPVSPEDLTFPDPDVLVVWRQPIAVEIEAWLCDHHPEPHGGADVCRLFAAPRAGYAKVAPYVKSLFEIGATAQERA